jgi:D-alanyl-D-alanine carboxypeptidase/D-alanyl-D-alanine-endopeptidase (penicillin-binding protein 4)
MVKAFTRRAFLATGLAGLGSSVLAAPVTQSLRPKLRPESLRQRVAPGVEALIKQAGLRGQLSLSVVDVGSGRVLEGYRAGNAMPPASVAKALTALYALDTLGAGYRFPTFLKRTGPVENGVLKGDLVLEGGAIRRWTRMRLPGWRRS